jgi:hypothetical protein
MTLNGERKERKHDAGSARRACACVAPNIETIGCVVVRRKGPLLVG